MLDLLAPEEVQRRLHDGTIRLVDVREPDEYVRESITGAELYPLSAAGKYPLPPSDLPVVFTCQSGNRTKKNADLLARRAQGRAFQMEGGMKGWMAAGLPVERVQMPMPLFRQIQIGAGSLVLLGLLLHLIWPSWIWLSAFVGAGLIFAGVTGFCGLGVLLSQMPWNRR